jgi:hypothetical protein
MDHAVVEQPITLRDCLVFEGTHVAHQRDQQSAILTPDTEIRFDEEAR